MRIGVNSGANPGLDGGVDGLVARAQDLEAQMAVKDVFDPSWLLNPAKVFPLAISERRRGALVAAE